MNVADIGPIVGAEPGSQSWTRGMPHEGWRKMTEWFIRRYKKVPLELETVSDAPFRRFRMARKYVTMS